MKKNIFLIFILLTMVSCKKEKTATEDNRYRIVVKDQSGQLQPNAEIRFFHSVQDLISGTNAYFTSQTDSEGMVIVPESEVTDTLICLAQKGTLTSEFLALKYTPSSKIYSVVIQQPADEQLLCGHGAKKWLMTSYIMNGTPQNYVVTSTLNADGTWTDTNGNSGTWHFENNHAQLVYDYTTSGMVVAFDVMELNQHFISLKTNQAGMVIEMEMTAVY